MSDYQTPKRMALKEKAIPIPDLRDKTVLDVGCDYGHWCWRACAAGAKFVTGLDRNRVVKGKHVDLVERNRTVAEDENLPCQFKRLNLGKQWHDVGKHDVTFCFSMYHHAFENCGNHKAIWFWLWRHTNEVLLWENPVSDADPVVRLNVTHAYSADDILAAAEQYFSVEHIGPALHVPTREVWRCWPKNKTPRKYQGLALAGTGGATKAFQRADNERQRAITDILGVNVVPGTLNVRTDRPFHWGEDYFVALLPDAGKPGDDWNLKGVKFYPVEVHGGGAFAIRFDGAPYKENFVELVADRQLRLTVPERFEFG